MRTKEIDHLVITTREYYAGLIDSGIPQDLATRIVGDWYSGVVQVAVNYYGGRLRIGSEQLSRRMARDLGFERTAE